MTSQPVCERAPKGALCRFYGYINQRQRGRHVNSAAAIMAFSCMIILFD
jgi:hypothetical protein